MNNRLPVNGQPGNASDAAFNSEGLPLLDHPLSSATAFRAEDLVASVRRIKGMAGHPVPEICILEFDGDLTDAMVTRGLVRPFAEWPCFHTTMWHWESDKLSCGIVARTIGGSYAVLIAEQLLVCGAKVIIGLTSAGRVSKRTPVPSVVVADGALRDEGTSFHYLAPSRTVKSNARLADALSKSLSTETLPLVRGMVWTTDAPYRETAGQLNRYAGEDVLAVEMQAASMFAFGQHHDYPVGLVIINSILLRLVAPIGAVGVALFAESQGWGLFHYLEAPSWLAIPVSVILLDLAIYLQHVMFHAVPLFWRLHMVHHADLDFDVTTGLRFHTIEILLSFGIKAAVVLVLGAPGLAVLVFEVLLNATSMFNHSNIRMPLFLDRILRWVVVTPDMHRVHHSIHRHETNSNFGFSLPWWDRLLGTYRDQPADGHTGMTIGLSHIRDEKQADRLLRMLSLPFRERVRWYAIGGDEEKHGKKVESSNTTSGITPEPRGHQ